MPIYPPRPAPFECVICGDRRPQQWVSPEQQDYPPLCWPCEQYGWRQGSLTRNPDRRLIKQITALAEAIIHDANLQNYRQHHGRA